MASFNRKQYQDTFDFALMVYSERSTPAYLERKAVEIMKACEGVLGQQIDFPEHERK